MKTPDTSIEILLAQCAQGQRKAQQALYNRYAAAMFSICRRMLGHEAEAEDALQEAFVKAFRNIEQFQGESAFGAWLKRIVVNQCLNALRARKDWERPWEEGVDLESLPTAQVQWPALEVNMVKQAILQLPDGFRVVLSLYLLEGYDHQEIAEILGISVSTSKSQYSRAKAKLRELLGGARQEMYEVA